MMKRRNFIKTMLLKYCINNDESRSKSFTSLSIQHIRQFDTHTAIKQSKIKLSLNQEPKVASKQK